MRIACLHTAESNAAHFDDAARQLGIEVSHTIRDDLYLRALEQGGADEAILQETAAALSALDGDAALLTCSTLGPAAPLAGACRVDSALAEAAAKACGGPGARIDAFVTTPTTIAPTRALFRPHAEARGASVNVILIEDALDLFLSGAHDDYAAMIAATAGASRADVVALAQASMTPAARLMDRPALTSPLAGLRQATEMARRARLGPNVN